MVNLLKTQIEDEMTWLKDTFCDCYYPEIISWSNSNAEERYKNLKTRLDYLNKIKIKPKKKVKRK